jgi:plastocyanin
VERAVGPDAGRRRSGAFALAFLVVVAAAILTPLIRTAPAAHATEAPEPLTVRILSTGVDPALVQVDPGETVVWVNRAGATRSILAMDASFDSGPLADGEKFQFAFTEPRTVSYSVVQAPGISGTVVVHDPSAPVPTPGPVATPAPGAPPAAPAGFAYTGSATAVNGAIGGLVLALGAGLVYLAQRFGVVAAISRLTFSHASDDLLPTRRARRIRKAEARRGRIRR